MTAWKAANAGDLDVALAKRVAPWPVPDRGDN